MSIVLGGLVLVPIAGAVLVLLAPARAATGLTAATAAAVAGGTGALVLRVAGDGPVGTTVGGWEAPLGIELHADGLSALMLAVTAAVGVGVTGYATGSEKVRGGPAMWPLWLLLWAGLNAVYVSGDLFNAYVALELMGIAAVALVALGGPDALAPALRYLFVAVTGSLAYLVAVALVYGQTGTLEIADAGTRVGGGVVATAVIALTAVGMALKTALFPLHAWLPPAHAAAPAAVSPVLSALVVKASFYLLVRVWFAVGGGTEAAALLLGVLGAGAVLWGSALALRQERLKRVVAYSTVAQVGYLFLLFPLVSGPRPGAADSAAVAGWTGALTLVLAHALAKSALFMSAGSLALAHGSDDLAGLRGAATRMPMTAMTMALAGASLAGLPPTLGFVGKWQLLQGSLGGGQWWWALLLLAGTLLTVAYVGRVLRATFGGPEADHDLPPLRSVPRRMELIALTVALAAVVLGLGAGSVLDLVVVGVEDLP